MKRAIEREKKLKAFSLDIDELSVLWDKINSLFDETKTGLLDNIHKSITIKMGAEELRFDSIEELINYTGLPNSVSKFHIYFSQCDNMIMIFGSTYMNSIPEVKAKGDSELWCAGAVDTVVTYLNNHKIWYHWLLSLPSGIILAVMINILILGLIFKLVNTLIVFICFLISIITLLILILFKIKLLPSSILQIKKDNSFFQKYTGQLSLIIGIIGATAGVIGAIAGIVSLFKDK